MINLMDFNSLEDVTRAYGGATGPKKAVIIDGDHYMLKMPQVLRHKNNTLFMNYASSPQSEYLGSHIYAMLGKEVYKTLMRYEKILKKRMDIVNEDSDS